MAIVKPFTCIRPNEGVADKVAALPYDVYSRKEAKEAVKGNPLSFLNIDRPETQYEDDFDMYSDKAYETARDMLDKEIEDGVFVTDEESYYIYELTMDGRKQTGIAACCSIDDYKNQVIKKHENTRREKEEDRVRHISACKAQTGPIFLAYRDNAELDEIIEKVKKESSLYDFTSDDGIRHRVWKTDRSLNKEIEDIFAAIDSIYIADGHHRAASACRVGSRDGLFMAVLFSDKQLKIMAYNRAVKDLNSLSKEEFFDKIKKYYEITEKGASFMPEEKSHTGMYISGKWYELILKKEYRTDDPVDGLDVSRLQDLVLAPVLGIRDPRTDSRISFVGGIRGNKELERLVDACGYSVAFSMFPTQMSELLNTADAGKLMPPKSTWFEPKLRSGLFIHRI